MSRANRLASFLETKLKAFKGYSFEKVVTDELGESIGLALVSKDGTKKVVFWLLSDEEGNDIGFVDAMEIENKGGAI